MAARSGFVRTLVWTTGGLLVWGAHLGLVYGVVAVVCARRLAQVAVLGLPATWMAVGALTVVALAITGLVLARSLTALRGAEHGSSRRFLAWMAAFAAGFSLVAIAWTALPAFVLATPCGS